MKTNTRHHTARKQDETREMKRRDREKGISMPNAMKGDRPVAVRSISLILVLGKGGFPSPWDTQTATFVVG